MNSMIMALSSNFSIYAELIKISFQIIQTIETTDNGDVTKCNYYFEWNLERKQKTNKQNIACMAFYRK